MFVLIEHKLVMQILFIFLLSKTGSNLNWFIYECFAWLRIPIFQVSTVL